MNAPKKHHFVPQMLLRRFCDDTGKLWFYNKKAPHVGVASGDPQKLFYEKHLYTLREGGCKDTGLETYFSKLEGEVDAIIEKICTAARVRRHPRLSDHEKKIWNLFVYFQWKRTPDSIAFRSDAEFEELLGSLVTEFEQDCRPLTKEERDHIFSESGMKRLLQNARVKAIGDPGAHVQNLLNKMGIGIAVIRKPNKSFIIGSKPVAKLTPPGETRLGQPDVEVWLPIAADVAVYAIPREGTEEVIELTNDGWLRYFNSATLRQSTMIAGRSKALVSSLIHPR